MAIFSVLTFALKPDHDDAFLALLKRFILYRKMNYDLFKEVKSFAVFKQQSGPYVMTWGYDALDDYERMSARVSKDAEWGRLQEALRQLVDDSTYRRDLWKTVL
jgi:hypothetical protein